jgi:hypothetical protein
MNVLVYLNGPAPNAKERETIKALEDEGHVVEQINGKFFAGQHHQMKYPDIVVTERKNVQAAYEGKVKVVGLDGKKLAEKITPPRPPVVEHYEKGGGWWAITVDGEEVKKVRKKDLSEALKEYGSLV